uniref:Uncharacterized protein n=1 Tax=Alexandrium andersonii TaxID=327968 RepID=A0A7S2AF37_9DINO
MAAARGARRAGAGQAWAAQRRRLLAGLLAIGIYTGALEASLSTCWSLLSASGRLGGDLQTPPRSSAQAPRCRDARSSRTALHATAAVEVSDSKVNKSELSKSFVTLSIGGQALNVTWSCREEHGDTDCIFQVTTKNSTARFSDHAASGEGWSITSQKFELQSPTRPMHTVAYTIDNPHGIDQKNEAPAYHQVTTVFSPSLEGLGVTPTELIDIVEANVPAADVRYWPAFKKYWNRYV